MNAFFRASVSLLTSILFVYSGNAIGTELPEEEMATAYNTALTNSTNTTETSSLEGPFVMAEFIMPFKLTVTDADLNLAMQEAAQKEIKCLARNIYFEARGESYKGQKAVGLVTINRMLHPAYPSTICEVVRQPKQFSWVGRVNKITQPDVYEQIVTLATQLYIGYAIGSKSDKTLAGATHFHTTSIRPGWRLQHVVTIGNHVFLKPKK